MSDNSDLQDYTYKSSIEYAANAQHYIRAGIDLTYHHFVPQTKTYIPSDTSKSQTFVNDVVNAFETALFIEDEWKLTKTLKVNVGIRLNNYSVPTKNYYSIEPRLTLLYSTKNDLVFKAAYSRMQQNTHLLSNNGIGYQNDIWVPSTDSVRPQQSEQSAVGVSKYFSGVDIEVSLEAYRKTMTDLIDFKEGANFINSVKTWERAIEINGTGQSKGIELFVHKKSGRLNGFISYTFASTTRQFTNINGGDAYPFKYDNPHSFATTFNYQISKHWDFSATWVFKTGQPISLPIYTIENSRSSIPHDYLEPTSLFIYSRRNEYRLPNYHRLDATFNYSKQTAKGATYRWSFSAFNAYNRANVAYIYCTVLFLEA